MKYPSKLGAPEVSVQGLGGMGMSEFYGAGDDAESIAVSHPAFDLGGTLLDTSRQLGPIDHIPLDVTCTRHGAGSGTVPE